MTFTDPAHEIPVLRLDEPAEVLSYLPYRVGFTPRESLVLLSVRLVDDRPELGVTARIDLADLAGRTATACRDRLLAQLAADGAVCALAAVYTDTPWPSVLGGTSVAARVLRWWLGTGWGRPEHAWLVSGTRFRCVECAEEPCCPDVGRPRTELETSAISARLVYDGAFYAASREELVPELRRDPDVAAAAVRAAARDRRRRAHLTGPALESWRADRRALWRRLVGAGRVAGSGRGSGEALGDIPPAELGNALVGLEDVAVRDALILSLAGGTRVEDPGDPAAETVLNAVFAGALHPDSDRVRGAEAALGVVAAHAARGRAGEPLAVLAWLAWWCGEGARADILLERALAQDPGHRLARLLRRAVDHGIPPGWARPHRSA